MAAPERLRGPEVARLPRAFPSSVVSTGAAEGRSWWKRARPCLAMECCRAGEAWDAPGGSRRRRRRRRKEERDGGGEAESPEEAGERQMLRLREAGSELQSSKFWDSSFGIILKSLPEHPAAGKGATRPSTEEALCAFEKMQLIPQAESVSEPSSRLKEEPSRSRAQGLQCVCYGIGNFSSCVQARYQLAFLLLLLEELKIPEYLCYIFDPVFSTLEMKVLAHLGLTVLLENEEGKRCIHNPTIFYMVHCGKALYNNLLWSNWSIEALSKMVIIGNSFKGIEDRVLSRIFQKDYSYIAKVLVATDEEALPPHPLYLDIFNDTSVHCFPLEKLRDLPPEIWKLREEPVYPEEEQPEIIRNQK